MARINEVDRFTEIATLIMKGFSPSANRRVLTLAIMPTVVPV
jgi:hypothetical protein